MFGLCMPTGETYLILKNGIEKTIMLSDEEQPRKHIFESEHVLNGVKSIGYENIDKIVYKRNNHKTIVSMAEYYYEHAKELEVK